ncbi:MAG: outer membrane beta-barrel protein [Bacteroidales bacterium]
MRYYTLLILFIAFSAFAPAQIHITGTVLENRSNLPLTSATVSLTQDGADKKPFYATTDPDGKFSMLKIPQGSYTLKITFIGFKPLQKKLKSLPESGKLGSFYLQEESIELNEVVAKGRATRATQKADTLAYNASAFKTMAGSSTEQLIAKMPGIVVDANGVQAQGEQIKKILVDGKPFFEGDPALALRNLPADMVESIEVFDKMSEQAEFAGFDDGNTQKTINIRTRAQDKAKQFGRASAGFGTENRYLLNGSYNYFKGDRRISILGMSNNINQQNFSQEDIAGAMGGGGRRRSMRGGGSDFMIGQLPGITNTTALGINYSDQWGEKMKVTGSYFFNRSKNDEESFTKRSYFETNPYVRNYDEEYSGTNTNYNHRINLKLDYTINDRNVIQFRPSLSFQDNSTKNETFGMTYRDGEKQNSSQIYNNNTSDAYNLGGELLFRHRFKKKGRTASVSVSGNANKNDGTNYYTSYNEFFLTEFPRIDTVQRYKVNDRMNYRLRGGLTYSEPLTKNAVLNLNYRVNYSNNDSDRRTYRTTKESKDLMALLDTALTNIFKSDYVTQQVGAGLRIYNKEGLSLYATLNFEHASLYSDQTFPKMVETDKNFWAILPFVRLDYKINSESSFRLMLRANSNEPSVAQLQNVINNNNPLLVTGGNPDLAQENSYNTSMHYTHTTASGKTFFAMIGGNITKDYIGTETIIADKPTDIGNGIILEEGAQLTTPVNLNGSWGANAMITFGMPIDFLKSNLNINTMFKYNRLPGRYNGIEQVTDDYGVTPGFVLSSNISDRLDFTVSYNSRLNFTKNNLDKQKNNNYFNQVANAKLNWEFWKGFTTEVNFSYQNYTGMTDGFNQNYYLLNASLGRKFLKSKRLEVKLTAYDLLRQNSALSRNVTNNYYEDVTANVLSPYFMATVVYDLRLFSGNKPKRPNMPGGGHAPMMPPHGQWH